MVVSAKGSPNNVSGGKKNEHSKGVVDPSGVQFNHKTGQYETDSGKYVTQVDLAARGPNGTVDTVVGTVVGIP